MDSFSQAGHHFYKDSKFSDQSLKSCTHLGVGAHPDDLEVMAHHGILQCLNSEEKNFVGVTCTNGKGSSRPSEFAGLSDEEFVALRRSEQLESAQLGSFMACALLDFGSGDIKNKFNPSLLDDLKKILRATEPEVIYTHNVFDKHKTHVSVTLHLVKALKELSYKPKSFYGCEVWRGLDWISDSQKQTLPIDNADLIEKMILCHKSQTTNKNYAHATLGRMKSNATFFDSGNGDEIGHQLFSVDLMPLIEGESIESFAQNHIERFHKEVRSNFEGLV